jgi:hypothetical protein
MVNSEEDELAAVPAPADARDYPEQPTGSLVQSDTGRPLELSTVVVSGMRPNRRATSGVY